MLSSSCPFFVTFSSLSLLFQIELFDPVLQLYSHVTHLLWGYRRWGVFWLCLQFIENLIYPFSCLIDQLWVVVLCACGDDALYELWEGFQLVI